MTPQRCLCLLGLATLAAARVGNWSSGALGDVIQKAEAPGGNVVTIDFFYGPKCSHCLDFMRLALIPLLEAGLPGDRVKLSVLPFIKIEDTIPVELGLWDNFCRQTDICYYALVPLCALKVAAPGAVPVSDVALAKAVRFAECNQARRLASHPNGGMEVNEEMKTAEDTESRQCAEQAGVPYDGAGGIKACADGPEVMGLIHSPGYTDRIRHFEHLMQKSGVQQMPYIFLNNVDVLRCDESPNGVDCSGIWEPPATDRLLQHGGSLLRVVCSRLQPQPVACQGVSTQRVHVGPTPKCENCAEVGSFHYEGSALAGRGLWLTSSAGIAAGLALTAAGVLVWRRSSRSVDLPEDSACELIAE